MARSETGRLRAVILAIALVAGSGPALAQMSPEEEQRCVWRCLADSPGAASKQYNDCVERMCVAPQPSQPRAAAPAPGRKAPWTAGGGPGGSHYAGVEIPGAKSFSFLCKPGGPGLLAVAGMGRGADGVGLAIDGKAYGLPFVSQNGILYTAASGPILRALMGGSAVQVRTRSGAASFPLGGSGGAIRKALAGCGMKL